MGMAAAAAAAESATVAAVGSRLEPPAGGGEDCLTLGWKLCPPYIFTIAGLEKGRIWRGWEEERFHK